MKYHELKTEFISKGFKFKQLKRVGDVAIFRRFKSKKNSSFELIIIKRHDGYTLDNAYIEPAETYPTTSQWGLYGWTFTDLDKCEDRFQKLLKTEERRSKESNKKREVESKTPKKKKNWLQ